MIRRFFIVWKGKTWILLRKSACQSNMKLIFNEVTYLVDYLKVKALMMIPKNKKISNVSLYT